MSADTEALRLARDRFEAYFADSRRNRGPSKRPTFERFADGTYADDHTQRHWWTWQCALAALPPQAEPADSTNTLEWLASHCRAIGMTKKSDSGLLAHDIALFTIELESLRKDAERLCAGEQAEEGPRA